MAHCFVEELKIKRQREICLRVIKRSQDMPVASKVSRRKNVVEEPVTPPKVMSIHANSILGSHSHGFVHARRISPLSENKSLPNKTLNTVSCPARHKHCGIASLEDELISVQGYLHPTLKNAQVFSVVLNGYVH